MQPTGLPSLPTLRSRIAKFWLRTRRAISRINRRQNDDHVVFLAGSLAFFSVISLIPICAVSLSLFASYIDDEQEEVFYNNILEYVFPFSPENRLSEFSPFQLRDEDAGIPGVVTPTLTINSTTTAADSILDSVSITYVTEAAPPTIPEATSGVDLAQVQQVFLENIRNFTNQARNVGWVGLFFLVLTGIWLFDSIEDAFNSIWRADKRRPFIRRFTVFWTVLTFTPLLMVGPMFIDRYIVANRAGFEDYVWVWALYSWAWLFLPYLLTWFAIWLLYVVVPNGTVAWKPAAIAALGVALLWELAKHAFAEYVARAEMVQSVYGGISLISFVLGWIYLTWWLILEGFEVAAYLQFPDWDQAVPSGDIAPEISLFYAWGGLYEIGKNFAAGKGGKSTEEISQTLGLHKIPTLRILETMEDQGMLARDRKGYWYPAIPLEKISWSEVAHSLRFDFDDTYVTLSDWLESALRARGLKGFRQETTNLPSLAAVLAAHPGDTVEETLVTAQPALPAWETPALRPTESSDSED